jgi:hypothetical protein
MPFLPWTKGYIDYIEEQVLNHCLLKEAESMAPVVSIL